MPTRSDDDTLLVPAITGDWWQVAANPDLGPLTGDNQQPVDFSVWHAADGTWQLWSCVRHTKEPGMSRLFYRWEGRNLTDRDWRPMGVAMHADPRFGETAGGLQAPHVVPIDGVYHMFYGDWEHVCLATSTDGKTFERRLDATGRAGMFGEGAGANARDPMVIRAGDLWHCYYTAHPDKRGAVYCRTSPDLVSWSPSTIVAAGGEATGGPYSAECPHVLYHAPSRHYYLFRTQAYGPQNVTRVYRSPDPLDFGVDDDTGLVARLPIAAPEVVEHDGRLYIASLLPDLQGIRIARLEWVSADAATGVGVNR